MYIDGYYPLYSKEDCAKESSPVNAATTHVCSRFDCNNVSWTAPCSTGQVVTKQNCLSGHCTKKYSATCYDDRFLLSPLYYGGTCSITSHSGPSGTYSSCTGLGGTWQWPATLDDCRDYAVLHMYSYFSFHPSHSSLKCMLSNSGISSAVTPGYTSCGSGDPILCPECPNYTEQTCPGAPDYEWLSDGHTWDQDAVAQDYFQPNGLREHTDVWYGDYTPIGLTGDKGDKGDTGDTGEQGVTGSTGTRGFRGFNGTTGATGVQGEKGERGFNGTDGITGVQGERGFNGTDGITGLQGEQGVTGATGAKGDRGFNGTDGITGPQGAGVTGPQGLRGFNGTDGVTGPKGETGKTPIRGMWTPNADPVYVNGDIVYWNDVHYSLLCDVVLGCTYPINMPGVDTQWKSINGATGAAGLDGLDGVTGPQGLRGFNGTDGKDGIDGNDGATGAQGEKGRTPLRGMWSPNADPVYTNGDMVVWNNMHYNLLCDLVLGCTYPINMPGVDSQ